MQKLFAVRKHSDNQNFLGLTFGRKSKFFDTIGVFLGSNWEISDI